VKKCGIYSLQEKRLRDVVPMGKLMRSLRMIGRSFANTVGAFRSQLAM